MAKRILTLCLALAIGIAFAMPAAAAVKSIKVGGDITVRGIYRDNLDFFKDTHVDEWNTFAPEWNLFVDEWNADPANVDNQLVPVAPEVRVRDNNSAWLMTTTRVWVGAELTDNVSAVVRLLNERDWNAETNESTDVSLDLAYIKMKDLFVPGLTATLGRQEILLGKGFVVGNINGAYGSNLGAIKATDLTSRKSFDAWRLDYEVGTIPLTFTLFDAKILESALSGVNLDFDLAGLNVAYKLDNAVIEGYVLRTMGQLPGDDLNIYTYGARVDQNVLAVPGLNYNIEAALQTGDVATNLDQDAWAGNADVNYTFQNPMQPKVGAAWYYASGDKNTNNTNENWISLFPDNLGDRIGRLTYATTVRNFNSVLGAGSNLSVPKIYASIKPAEKHLVSLAYFPASTIAAVESGGKDELGYEVNLGYTYQYTEDVSFGLCVDYAVAGDGIKQMYEIDGAPVLFDSDALQVIGTVAVSF